MQRASLLVLSALLLTSTAPCRGQDAPPATLPTALPLTATVNATSPYSALQEAWDNNFQIRNTSAELMDEGRYAPARKNWVLYYSGLISQNITNLQAAVAGTTYQAELGGTLTAMQNASAQLETVANAMKSPTDDKYPAAFWAPARDLIHNATSFDQSLVKILATLEAGVPPQANAPKLQASAVARAADLDGLTTATKKVIDNISHLSAELDRLNLGWGPPPKQPLQDEFYQGAFTKQEIMSQYKYMPSFVFTTDPEVARFTYRMPPRRNVLADYTNRIGKLLNLMDGELQNIQATISASNDQALAAPWKAMETTYIDARKQYMTLYQLVQTMTDDQLAKDIRGDQTIFGKPIIAMRNDMEQLRDAITDFVTISK